MKPFSPIPDAVTTPRTVGSNEQGTPRSDCYWLGELGEIGEYVILANNYYHVDEERPIHEPVKLFPSYFPIFCRMGIST